MLFRSNRAQLLFTTTGIEPITPFIALGVFVAGCLLGAIYYRWSRQRYDAVGKFLHEEA